MHYTCTYIRFYIFALTIKHIACTDNNHQHKYIIQFIMKKKKKKKKKKK